MSVTGANKTRVVFVYLFTNFGCHNLIPLYCEVDEIVAKLINLEIRYLIGSKKT